MKRELKHFGIPGMHWGIRKNRVASSDHKISRVLKKKHVSEMSNEELQVLTKRLQLEQNYKTLSPNNFTKGHNFVKGTLAVGTTMASIYALAQTPLFKNVKKAIQDKVSS